MAVMVQPHFLEAEFAHFSMDDPDLTAVLDWVNENVDLKNTFKLGFEYDPDDLFEDRDLEEWAKKNGFVEERFTISREDVGKLLKAIGNIGAYLNNDDGSFREQIDQLWDIAEIVQDQL